MDLTSYLKSDPDGLGLAALIAADNDVGVYEAITAKTTTKVDGVTRADFAIWAAGTGVRSTIQDLSADTNSPLRPSALSLLDFLMGGVAPMLQLDNANNMALIDTWVAMGAITAEQKQQLIAMATIPASHAEINGFNITGPHDIAKAVRADDGTRLV